MERLTVALIVGGVVLLVLAELVKLADEIEFERHATHGQMHRTDTVGS